MNEPRHKTGPRMTMQQEEPQTITMQAGTGRFGFEGANIGDLSPQTMESAPKDGRVVWLFDAKGTPHECYWRQTREFRNGRWNEIGVWAPILGQPAAISFEPQGWYRAP